MSAPEPRAPDRERRTRRGRLADSRVGLAGLVGLALLLLTHLLFELLGGAVSDSPVGRRLQLPLTIVAYVAVALASLVLLVGLGTWTWRWVKLRHAQRKSQRHQPGVTRTLSPVRHLAEQAAHWGGRLAGDAAAEAAGWFRDRERSLRRLLAEGTRTDDPLSGEAVDDLAAVAHSLETWYVRRGRLAELAGVNDNLRQVASRAGRPDLLRLAALRAATVSRLRGDLAAARAELDNAKEIGERTHRHRHAAALEARQHHEWALVHLAEAKRHTEDHKAAADELENAARVLEAEWVRLPRSDISGQITTLVNLAATALQLERLNAMAGRRDPTAVRQPPGGPDHRRLSRVPRHLGLAEALARAERDLTGLAHVIELRGVAAWLDDQHRLAVEWWRDARDRYAELGFADGQARCLQHLGSAVVVVPEVAGFLRDNRWVALDERATESEARSLLERSKALRANLPHVDTELVDHYLAELKDHRRLPHVRRRTDSLRARVRAVVARALRRRTYLS